MTKIDDIKKRYEKKDPRVREYMNILVDSLVEQYGTVHEEWIITLDLISTNFEVYYKGYDDIIANGIYVYDKNGYKQRNSAITLQQNTIPSNIGTNEKINKNTIKVNITCPLVNESIFIGKKCYLFVTKQNKQYEATIAYVNDKLEATLPTDISFEKAEDYVIYAYLPSGIYTSNGKSIEIPTIYSNTKMISARYNLVPEITGVVETQLMYPGSVTFDVVVDNIFNENVPIKIQVKDSNTNIIYSYTTNFTKANHTHTVTLTSLNAGTYTINATITDKNITTSKTLTISKASLQQSNDALTNVVTNPHQKININISSLGKYINDGDLGTI